jgi:hypothetical protein
MSDPGRWKPKPPGSPPAPLDEDARVRVAVRWYRLVGPVALAVALSRTWVEPFEEVGGTYWWIVWDFVFLAVTLVALFGSLHFVSRVWYIPRFGLPLLLFALTPLLVAVESGFVWVGPFLATLAGWATPLPREE